MSTDENTLNIDSFDWKRNIIILTGIALFLIVYYMPSWADAVDPMGKSFELSKAAKGGLGILILAAIWWYFEVVPVGVTSLAIGVLQALFLIRPAKAAFKDFMDPSVMFIFASFLIGAVFTKTGLTKRLAYKMLIIVGEKTSMIYLGCFIVTAALSHIMAHSAVAATIYPLLVSIYALYGEGDKQTKFGKGLFIGMAYVAGAGSIVTILGAARGAVALGFYNDIIGENISFFQLSYYMFPIGWAMVFILWGFFMIFLKPEKKVIPGLREKATRLSAELGPMSRHEILAAIIVGGVIIVLFLKQFIPALQAIDKTGIILVSSVLFFTTGILDVDDLDEQIGWNIILLFAGAMSLGFCLWETGAAEWLAVMVISAFQNAHWFVFIIVVTLFMLLMTNVIMNVAAITIILPVALVIAPYLKIAPEVITFASLVAAGMPFLLLVGAAPNAIAYTSKQFTSREFMLYGIPASIILMVVIGVAVLIIWPLMGMPITLD